MAYRHDGFFYAMDTYREYQHLNDFGTGRRRPGSSGTTSPLLPRLVSNR